MHLQATSTSALAPFVGNVEILCGTLVFLGLFTRFTVCPQIATMLTAIATTRVPILLKSGFWKMAHEARTDWSMLLACLFLTIVGAGAWSMDARRSRSKSATSEPA
jgi:putative oxidoreductase